MSPSDILTRRAAPRAPAGEYPQRAARRRGMLSDRAGLGPLAAVVAEAFRPGYVRRMAELRQRRLPGRPHEILDPRDLKYCRNLCDCSLGRRRRSVPLAASRSRFARWGLAELQLMGWPLLALTRGGGLVPLVSGRRCRPCLLALVVYFFRDPPRRVPQEPGLMVSPADGTIAEITRLEHDEFIGGPAVRIGIFLSIFNVHMNRAAAGAG